MKKICIIILLMACATTISLKTYANKITIQVSSFTFLPSSVNATVGDTIVWVWVNGSHTTTCNGTANTARPSGAASWDHPMNSGSASFEYVLTVAGNYQYKCTPHAPNMAGIINVAPANGIVNLNGLFNYLEINPPTFKSDAIVKFSLSANAHIKLSIYDFAGRKVETLLDSQYGEFLCP